MTFNITYVLSLLCLIGDKEKDVATKQKEDDYLCRDHILNVLLDSLFNIYTNTATSKENWKALAHKYKTKM